MATKTIDKTPVTIEQLRAKLTEKLTGTPFEVPEWGTVEVAMLKNIEIERLTKEAKLPDGTTDVHLWNRMSASFGLVSPQLSPEELEQFPQSFIVPVANKAWELTNAYGEKSAEDKKKGEAPNFPKQSSSISDSPTPTDGVSPKSTP